MINNKQESINSEHKKMKILRVAMGYPTENLPGSGLNAYYHMMYSEEDDLLITAKKQSAVIPCSHGALIQVPHRDVVMTKPGQGKVYAVVATVKKYTSQYMFFLRTKRYVDQFKPDVVHIYTPIPIGFGNYCRRKYNSLYVMSLHGSDVERISKTRYLRGLLKEPDYVLSVGEGMIDKINGLKTKKPVVCIGNGVDTESFIDKQRDRKKQFIQVGSFRWQKDKETLLNAFALFVQLFPDYRLVLVGDGEERQKIEDKAKELDIFEHIDFMGVRGRDEIVDLLNDSVAFVLSSVSEGFPKVIYEAMATGTPVVSTDIVNVGNTIQDSGLVVPMKDAVSLSSAMVDIVHPERWKERSVKAKEYAAAHTWGSVSKKLTELYRKGLDEKQ
jgi:glycosyltransferase involved in cell wall biosynthesis